MSEYKDEILDHCYDGIQEFDNPMPSWWTMGFYATIVWSVVYMIGLGFGYIWDYERDLREGQKELEATRRAYELSRPPVLITPEALAAATKDEGALSLGKEAFASNCVACHGGQGQGGIGPNLTDDHWLRGATLVDVHRVVRDGTPNGMPPWGSVLAPEEVAGLVAYIATLQGTSPAGAKAPQGEPGKLLIPGQEEDKGGDEPAAPSDAPAPGDDSPAN